VPDIKHVVVLMLENRSFDHLLGYLDGLSPVDSAPVDPGDNQSARVPIHWLEAFSDVSIDPGHGFDDVMRQLTGTTGPWSSPYAITNDGFYWDYAERTDESRRRAADPTEIMGCYPSGRLRGLSTLAAAFAVCARWHCSLPSETWPNRLFAHAGTSLGDTGMTRGAKFIELHRTTTIYDLLDAQGCSWRVYHGDIPQVAVFGLRHENFRALERFYADATGGDLPAYTFIEPQYFDFPGDSGRFLSGPGNSQHPVSKLLGLHVSGYVKLGDELIEKVYTALRSNEEVWGRSLLVVTHDEHGGFFDRAHPPEVPALPPAAPNFAFDLLGPRVPAVVVSPYVEAGTIDSDTLFDHTSLTATVRECFGIEKDLGAREASASTLTRLFTRSEPRDPAELPDFDERDPLADSETNADVPLHDFQRQLLELARHIDRGAVAELVVTDETTVAQAAPHVQRFVRRNFPASAVQ
jgi:phospholipase C